MVTEAAQASLLLSRQGTFLTPRLANPAGQAWRARLAI